MKRSLRKLVIGVAIFLPWPLKRLVLQKFLRFRIDKSARIGWSWLDIKQLEMGPGSSIGHFNIFKGIDQVVIGESSKIGRFNLITCVPTSDKRHYRHIDGRETALCIGKHSAITMRHIFDCNAPVIIGDFTTVAGYRSQFLTHSIDIQSCRQDAKPIQIGSYCFVGTACVVMGGASLPNRSVLGACSCMRDAFADEMSLYAGVPAKFKKQIQSDAEYLRRTMGWVA
jgi:acetyltransferase-like isoleucine patch superfamily enzyme